jgi:hypothetical protein
MVYVKGASDTTIGTRQELGLSEIDAVTVVPEFIHEDATVDAWGRAPVDIQYFLAAINVSMTLVNVDMDVLKECLKESMAGAAADGAMVRAGSFMGNGLARFAAGNHFIGLNLASPVGSNPWRIYFAYLTGPPITFPLGTKRSLIQLNWRGIPYTTDPWGNSLGALNSPLWDHTLDT